MTKREIERFFARKFKVYRLGQITLRIQKNNLNNIRTAFIVSSAVKRNAPARNLVRRRMSEIIRILLPRIKTGYDIIFSYKLHNKKAPSFSGLKNDIINLLSLCGVL